MVRNHPLIGNKRTGYLAAFTFLYVRAISLMPRTHRLLPSSPPLPPAK
ncbi:hypothetical protein [Rhizobium mongolense]